MFNVCESCGEYEAAREVVEVENGAVAVCPHCGSRYPFRYLPLFVLCGASGGGKTTIVQQLPALLEDVAVIMEADILLGSVPGDVATFFNTWLRVAKNIHQSGRSVVFGASGMIPQNVEPRVERRYFQAIHYLGVSCSENEQIKRLDARPDWRTPDDGWGDQIRYNNWIREESGLEQLDTTDLSIEEAAQRTAAWVRGILENGNVHN